MYPQAGILRYRGYSTPSPSALIKVTLIPAPHTGHIRILSLSSPHNRNAISCRLLSELSTEIHDVRTQVEEEWDKARRRSGRATERKRMAVGHGTRVLILASEVDEVFCAGADLKERKSMNREETHDFLTHLRATLSTLGALPIPTISAVSSVALGGGLELALATLFRVMASRATVGLPETRLGIIPGAGGTYRLARLVGETKALEMILGGQRIDGLAAHRMGMCEHLVLCSDDETKAAVREKTLENALLFAKKICEGGPRAIGAALRAVKGGSEEVENECYEDIMGTDDRDEALRAFAEKRGPVFRGV
ncbi:MAG: hypothetical protein Q9163_000100 [Psora crenata]